jgi:hypothetical protein
LKEQKRVILFLVDERLGMAFFTARILSKDDVIIEDNVEVWIRFFRLGDIDMWDGSLEIPATTPLNVHTYRIQLADGREGEITNITARIISDNIMVYFEGHGPLQ